MHKLVTIQKGNGKQLVSTVRIFSSYEANTDDFKGSKTGVYFQEKPCLGNQYHDDPLLSKYLKRVLPREIYHEIEADLLQFGHKVSTDIFKHHENLCLNEPVLQQYDAWGNRVDDIIMHPSWRAMHDISAKEGLIAIPYQNKYAQWSRLYQAAKLYMFSPSSGLYSCPLAMTDGASSLLQNESSEFFQDVFKRLTSRDPKLFWTSGQWMTEKQGGSDVGEGTETLAKKQSDGTYKLYGYKWFTSATDADVSLTLARIIDEQGKVKKKFKKKLGTRQMPTAELILDGTKAYRLSPEGRGIATISPMLSITRIHNSISAVAAMRRILNLSKDFAKKRRAFGNLLIEHPLHIQTLARLEIEQQAAFLFLMQVIRLFGSVENENGSDKEQLLLRILTPLLKLYTGKQAVSVASEGLESFGGHGYLEDTLIPVILRDAQVLSIWEGTTNILSLDVLRCIEKSKGEVLKAFFEDAASKLKTTSSSLSESQTILNGSLSKLTTFIAKKSSYDNLMYMKSSSRDLSYSLARTYMGCLLYEHAQYEKNDVSAHMVRRWCSMQDLTPVVTNEKYCYDDEEYQMELQMIYDNEGNK